MQTIDAILNAGNLTEACRQVVRNKGAAGVDAMSVKVDHCLLLQILYRKINGTAQPSICALCR